MKVDDGFEPACEQSYCGAFLFQRDHFGEVGIAIEAGGEARFRDDGNSKVWKLFFECADRAGQQQTISQGAETDQKDSCVPGELAKQVFSFQSSLR